MYNEAGVWQEDNTCSVREYLWGLCVKVSQNATTGVFAADSSLGGGFGCSPEWSWEVGQWRRLDERRQSIHGQLYLPLSARNATIVTVRFGNVMRCSVEVGRDTRTRHMPVFGSMLGPCHVGGCCIRSLPGYLSLLCPGVTGGQDATYKGGALPAFLLPSPQAPRRITQKLEAVADYACGSFVMRLLQARTNRLARVTRLNLALCCAGTLAIRLYFKANR